LGYALPHGSAFLEAAVRRGHAPHILVKAGLASQRGGGDEGPGGREAPPRASTRDFFWGRILYPIRGVKGEVAGFGARALGDAEPKYLNGPESPLFSKGRVLYGLFEALPQVRAARQAVLVEGYMDVLALHQHGFTRACAPLGTALTPEHAALLKRYADGVVLVFDPDSAGSAASLRGAAVLLERGLSVRIATVPGDLDPDELLLKGGPAAFEAVLAAARDLPDFQTTLELSRAGPAPGAEAKAPVDAEGDEKPVKVSKATKAEAAAAEAKPKRKKAAA
jgi:DNA primase